jgi:hypothetical protein
MRYLFMLLFVMFSGFIFLQYNDPDPLLWMALYGYIAVLLALGIFNIYNKFLIAAGLLIYFAGAIYLFPSVIEWLTKENGKNFMQSMNNEKMYIEETRECAGLLICFACTLLLIYPARKNHIKKQSSFQK